MALPFMIGWTKVLKIGVSTEKPLSSSLIVATGFERE